MPFLIRQSGDLGPIITQVGSNDAAEPPTGRRDIGSLLRIGDRTQPGAIVKIKNADTTQTRVRQYDFHVDETSFILDPESTAQILANCPPFLIETQLLGSALGRRRHNFTNQKSDRSEKCRHLKQS